MRRDVLGDTASLLNLAMVAGVGYLALKYVVPLLSTLGKGATAARDTLATGVAKALVGSTQKVVGSVVLSTGQEIPLASVQNTVRTTGGFLPDGVTPDVRFQYQGTTWQFLGPADETGTYYAQPL
jgi:hypothetical protein